MYLIIQNLCMKRIIACWMDKTKHLMSEGQILTPDLSLHTYLLTQPVHPTRTQAANNSPPWFVVVDVSVAGLDFMGWGASPTPNPPPFATGLGTGHGGLCTHAVIIVSRVPLNVCTSTKSLTQGLLSTHNEQTKASIRVIWCKALLKSIAF